MESTIEEKEKSLGIDESIGKGFTKEEDKMIASNSNGTVRGKRFTKEEDERIRKAVFDYIEANHLGEEGLDMVLHCRRYPKLKYCWEEIGAALPWRPFLSVYSRAHVLFERDDGNNWTREELERIRTSYEKNGVNWKEIAQELGNRRVQLKDAWRRYKESAVEIYEDE